MFGQIAVELEGVVQESVFPQSDGLQLIRSLGVDERRSFGKLVFLAHFVNYFGGQELLLFVPEHRLNDRLFFALARLLGFFFSFLFLFSLVIETLS